MDDQADSREFHIRGEAPGTRSRVARLVDLYCLLPQKEVLCPDQKRAQRSCCHFLHRYICLMRKRIGFR